MTKPITIRGRTQNQSQWAREIGITKEGFRLRLRRTSNPDYLLSGKYRQGSTRMSRFRVLTGKTAKEWAEELGYSANWVWQKLCGIEAAHGSDPELDWKQELYKALKHERSKNRTQSQNSEGTHVNS